MLSPGTTAPLFTLPDANGREVSLSDHRGQWVVFWWYPEANSSGCSMQAASIERDLDKLLEAGVVVLGASFNTQKENDDFACDKSLRLTLLSDPEKTVGEQYQVIRAPEDRHPTKPHRHTYIIDPDGVIAHAEDANDHALGAYGQHLLETVADLRAKQP